MYIDETGFNLNSCEEGCVVGKLFIESKSNEKLSIAANESDGRVIVIGFNNSAGDLILCIIIMKGSNLE